MKARLINDKKGLFNLDDYKWNGTPPLQQLDDGTVVLTDKGGESILQSVKSYTPPFIWTVEVQTDSNEVRFYYNKGRFILGYSVGENQFRFRDILTRSEGGLSNVIFKPNKMHLVEIEVGETSMTIRVDKQEIYTRKEDYKGINAPIGIGPAFESKVTVKSITVKNVDVIKKKTSDKVKLETAEMLAERRGNQENINPQVPTTKDNSPLLLIL